MIRFPKSCLLANKPLIDWGKKFTDEIANVRALDLDNIQEQYYLTKRQRIELLGDLLQKVKGELEKRDLSQVKTKDLVKIFSSLVEQTKSEETEII